MTQEEKELLLKDLSARLPYGVKFGCDIKGIWTLKGITHNGANYICWPNAVALEDVKPYLRPMSSITEEEKEELFNLSTMGNTGVNTCWESFGVEIISIHPRYGDYYSTDYKIIDWLNKKMFDYHGLNEKGLALEASEGMYNIKEK